MKRSKALKRAQKKYRQSEKGKAAQKKHQQTEKGKAALRQAVKNYHQSEKGKAALKRANKNYTQIKREILSAAKANGCIYCGETELVCLDFHHHDPKQKEFRLAEYHRKGIKRILNEIAKCDVVCANCHRKLHAGLL